MVIWRWRELFERSLKVEPRNVTAVWTLNSARLKGVAGFSSPADGFTSSCLPCPSPPITTQHINGRKETCSRRRSYRYKLKTLQSRQSL